MRNLARRQQIAGHDELRVIDRVLLGIERHRHRTATAWDLVDELVLAVLAELAAEDVTRAELHEAARRELGGEG